MKMFLRKFRFNQIRRLMLDQKMAIGEDYFPFLDYNYLCNRNNYEEIKVNIQRRKNIGDLDELYKYHEQYEKTKSVEDQKKFIEAAKLIPNRTDPAIVANTEPYLVRYLNRERSFDFEPFDFDRIAKAMRLYRREHIGNVAGHRSYYILGHLAELEHALIRFTVDFLRKENFRFFSVPDIIPKSMVEKCGMNLAGDQKNSQIYTINNNSNYCLAGTSEISLLNYYANRELKKSELPIKCAAVSRCYRAEATSALDERGIYRVHQFNKVEMIAICERDQSPELHQQLLDYQQRLFTELELYCRVLDMPPHELGAAAYRKFDIEAWMPGRKRFGEISSCSNCTDFQTRRLNIRESESQQFLHSINGTACAVPRLLIALIENNQLSNQTVRVPDSLNRFLTNPRAIRRQSNVPNLVLLKNL